MATLIKHYYFRSKQIKINNVTDQCRWERVDLDLVVVDFEEGVVEGQKELKKFEEGFGVVR